MSEEEKTRSEKCVNCGSAEIDRLAKNRFKCRHCGSIFETVIPKVFIQPGANVVFGKNVSVKGAMEIESGASVEFKNTVEFNEDGFETREN